VLEINCYMTGALKLDEVRDVMFTDEGQGDPITGLQEPTHFGRPRWPEIFKAVAGAHKGSEVGVFFCGPKVLSRKLRVECGKATRDTRGATTFAFHKENCWVQLGFRRLC
jgi:NADPH oxidase